MIRWLVITGLALGLARPAQAQLAVAEAGPMTLIHTANLFQQTVNTIEAIFQSTQWILELTGFDETGSGLDHGVGHFRPLTIAR